MTGNRKEYIDWMKALGMLFIIWGHCFPEGMSDFIYAFNVPVFFIISGYLTRRDETVKTCCGKMWDSLMLPYLVLAFIKCAGYMLKHIDDGQWMWSVVAILGGFHSIGDAAGCSNLWFVYCLVVVKLLFSIIPKGKAALCLTTVIMMAGAVAYNVKGCEWYWAVADATMAYPFFIIGNLMRYECKDGYERMLNCVRSTPMWGKTATSIILAFMVYGIATFNGRVAMYNSLYGDNAFLLALGAILGSMMVLIFAVMLENVKWNGVLTINMGMLVILTFHRELLHPLLDLLRNMEPSVFVEDIATLAFSCLVLVAFVPITLIVKRILPVALGRRRIKQC